MRIKRNRLMSAGIIAAFFLVLITCAKTSENVIITPSQEDILTLNENDIIIGLEALPVSDTEIEKHNQIVDALITDVSDNEIKLEYTLEDSSGKTVLTGHIIADNAKDYKVGNYISTKLRIYDIWQPDNTIETNYVLGE